jgi:hypothetical protein
MRGMGMPFTLERIAAQFVLLFLLASPASPQTTLNLSQDLVSLGIESTNMVPNQPSLDAGPLLQGGVTYARDHGIPLVVADPGAYYFLSLQDNTHVALNRIDNMTIDLHGADLIFTHPLHYGIIVYFSTNAVLQNFTADYQPLPFTQVRIVAVDLPNARLQYALEPGWPDPGSFNAVTGPPGSGPPGLDIHVFRSGQPVLGRLFAQLPLAPGPLPLINPPPAVLAAVRVGDAAVVAMKGFGAPLATNHCTSCTVRNFAVFSSPGAAFQALVAKSSLMERVYSIPKPGTDRLVSTFGMAFAPFVGPANQMRLCRSIRTMDDGFAFADRFVGTVQSQADSRNLLLEATAGMPSAIGDIDGVPNGSPVAFQRPTDGVILGTAVIVSQTAPTPSPPYRATFTFDRDLPGSLVGTVVYSTDPVQNGANSVLERSTVQSQSCCKGVYIQGLANSTIRGNYLRHAAWSGVFMLQSMAIGDPPTAPPMNLSISRNVIDGTNIKSDWWWFEFGAIQTVTLTSLYDLMAGSPLSNINVTDNFIADSGRSGVWLGNTVGGSVSRNYVLDANVRPDLANAYQPRVGDALRPLVVDTTSSGVVTAGNVVDNTSGRLFVTDTQYRELAAYMPGGTIRLNAYDVGALPNPVLTLTDADGGTTALPIQNATPHALDVQLPATAPLGGAFVTLTSSGQKYFGTLFIDSQDNIPAVNGCTFEASLSSTSVPSSANSVPILVVTQAGCPYPVVANDPFITVGGVSAGTGIVTVTFSANPGPTRSATIEIAGQPLTLTQASSELSFYAVSPCRVLDTRDGPPGGTPLLAGSVRTFAVRGLCAVPASARAVAANVTIVQPSHAGNLRLFPTGSPAPLASTVNFQPGQVRANNAILGLGSAGQVSVQTDMAAGAVHLVLDVVGWFE